MHVQPETSLLGGDQSSNSLQPCERGRRHDMQNTQKHSSLRGEGLHQTIRPSRFAELAGALTSTIGEMISRAAIFDDG